jgi:hypothetical protein
MKKSGLDKNSKELFWPALVVFFVGVHSIVLGLIIYFFTDFFYKFFFAASVDNLFFVRQSGIFLFLAGFFYLYPLLNLRNLYSMLLLVIFSKIVAVYFLVSNAGYTAVPMMIYLAAFFDGLMALVIAAIYLRLKKAVAPAQSNILKTEDAALKKAA